MYFFYIDESGTRDPGVVATRQDGTTFQKEPLYVLTAVGLFESRWKQFDRRISNLKLELADQIWKRHKERLELVDCEVKSTWLRNERLRMKESRFLSKLSPEDLKRVSDCYYSVLDECHFKILSVVIDKRHIQSHLDHIKLHKKAYELLLERIDAYLAEAHPKHSGVIVMDDTDKTINRALSMKHAYFQREGNRFSDFSHIIEYPFFSDSRLSAGIQLADLCGYNIYRAFRERDFTYEYFRQQLPHFYFSTRTASARLDGLYVWPGESELVEFCQTEVLRIKTEQPTLWTWAAQKKK